MDAWRTSCPRLPVWEEASDRGFVQRHNQDGVETLISVTDLGRDFLDQHRPHRWVSSVIQIEYLADHVSLIPILAEWHHGEWRHLTPGETIADCARRLRESATRDGCPSTFVALLDGELLGSASLVAHDMEIRPNLTPWLSALYVAPVRRRHGVGSALVQRVVQEAARLNVQTLYLFTTSNENEMLYAKLGWSVRERVEYLGKRRVVMEIPTASAARS
jgi:GNAT superfamily N-acetyltransferase